MFLAHTTAVAGVWLALGRSPGFRLVAWIREEAAREGWRPRNARWGQGLKSYRITPDATSDILFDVDGKPARSAMFWGADLATMTQDRLHGKLSRYRRYVDDDEWVGP